jgi:hypothetical protein
MKPIKTFGLSFGLAALMFSCSKSDPAPEIELPQFLNLSLTGATTVPNVKKLKLDAGTDTTFVIQMQYGGTTNYDKGVITAQIGVDASLVDAFNAAYLTDYQLIPDEAWSLSKTSLTIPDGSNSSDETTLTIRIFKIDYSKDCILPITIKSVSGDIPAADQSKTVYFVFEADVDTEAGRDGWKVLGSSSVWDPTVFDVTNVFDGDEYSYWHSHPFDANLNGMPQWFAIDMGNFKCIDGFTYFNRKDETSIPKHITIETSYDGEEWTKVLDVPELPQSRVQQLLKLEKTAVARFFRFNVLSTWSGDAWTYVAEISIYAGSPPEEETDMEIETWTIDSYSSQWNETQSPIRLLDGNKDTYWHSNPAGTTLPQWIIFDMQKSRKISGVKIWNRQEENYNIEPKHITFEVSDNKTTWTTVIDEQQMSQDKTKQIDLKAVDPKSGRYLRMTILTNWSEWPYTALGEVTPY